MWTISNSIWMTLLMSLAIMDIRNRKIPGELLVAAGVGSVIYHLVKGNTDIWLIVGGAVTGCLFVCMSKITEEGLGYGDSYGILALGVYLGLWRVLTVLGITFFTLLCVSVPLIWKKKMNRKVTLPFYPFLTGGYVLFLFMGG